MLNFYCQMIKLIKYKASKSEVLEIIDKSHKIEVEYLADVLNCQRICFPAFKIMEIIDRKKTELKKIIFSSIDSIYNERVQTCCIQAINFDETF
jgi:hypothetical protein